MGSPRAYGPLAAHMPFHREGAWREASFTLMSSPMRFMAQPQEQVVFFGSWCTSRRGKRSGSAVRFGIFFCSPSVGGSVALSTFRRSSRAAMSSSTASLNSASVGIELLTDAVELQALELGQLDGELVDLGVPPCDLVGIASRASEQQAGEFTQCSASSLVS